MKTKHRHALCVVALLAVTLAAAVAFPANAAVVSGQVNGSGSRGPVAGARVEIAELHLTATTGRDGSFRFADVPDGHYTLRIAIPGSERVVARHLDVAGQDVAVGATLGEAVATQSGANGNADEPVIVVTGRRMERPQQVAHELELQAPNLIGVLTAAEIRQLPDISAAEAVRRLPGVSAENDTAEARIHQHPRPRC